MASLQIYAGATALDKIQQKGFRQELFKVLVGASGGPKWFVLVGLDRYLFGEFFKDRTSELFTVGSSVGAWRMCCLAMKDPVKGIERLAHLYSYERYSANPTVREVTDSARLMLAKVLGSDGVEEIANNTTFRTHVVATRSKGICSSNLKWLNAFRFCASAILNIVSRRSLSIFFERTLFSNLHIKSPWANLEDISSSVASLNKNNLVDIMVASGSIPFLLEGVKDISGAKKGYFWDGGIIDYHFDWHFHSGSDLVLYPHFSAQIIPGWFDKLLKWRKVKEEYLDNVVLLTPSAEFIASLPGAKIPDRKDFQRYSYDKRVYVWQGVIEKSAELAEEMKALVTQGKGIDSIKPISLRDR